jgi:hypothetical protein
MKIRCTGGAIATKRMRCETCVTRRKKYYVGTNRRTEIEIINTSMSVSKLEINIQFLPTIHDDTIELRWSATHINPVLHFVSSIKVTR